MGQPSIILKVGHSTHVLHCWLVPSLPWLVKLEKQICSANRACLYLSCAKFLGSLLRGPTSHNSQSGAHHTHFALRVGAWLVKLKKLTCTANRACTHPSCATFPGSLPRGPTSHNSHSGAHHTYFTLLVGAL